VRQKRRGILPAGSLKVCDCNYLESLFDEEGLGEFGARGVTTLNLEMKCR
jgi:hypothetical protein